MKKSVLQHLVCPKTLRPLRLQAVATTGEDIIEGTLVGDAATYKIEQGIPSFVPPELMQTQTVRSFAQKWAKHGYYRTHTGKFFTDWWLQRYGLFDLPKLREFLRGMSLILDAGTGTGRDAANFVEHSSATVFAVDAAREALEAARKDVTHPCVAFIHADIASLPFPDESFDFINCDQVIHHTPDPRATFQHLQGKLKRGGRICCYVYRKKAVLREFTDDYIRERISKLPIDEALRVCKGITRLGQHIAEMRATIDLDEDIPLLGIRKGKSDLQRFFHWNVMKCFWNEEFDFFTNNIINFDWYHPEHCFRYEPHEFKEWFARGWEIEAFDVQEAGISCRARKV